MVRNIFILILFVWSNSGFTQTPFMLSIANQNKATNLVVNELDYSFSVSQQSRYIEHSGLIEGKKFFSITDYIRGGRRRLKIDNRIFNISKSEIKTEPSLYDVSYNERKFYILISSRDGCAGSGCRTASIIIYDRQNKKIYLDNCKNFYLEAFMIDYSNNGYLDFLFQDEKSNKHFIFDSKSYKKKQIRE